MGQVLIPDVPDDTITSFKQKAQIKGRTLEEELRDLLERNRTFTPEERVALSHRFHSQNPEIQPALTLDHIREGLM
jgi:plasmid stability protein